MSEAEKVDNDTLETLKQIRAQLGGESVPRLKKTKLSSIHLTESDRKKEEILDVLQGISDKLDSSLIRGARGERGVAGERGERGEPGEQGKSVKGPRGDKGIKGDEGKPGQSIVGPQGEQGIPGKNGSPDTGDEIVAKINSSKVLIEAKKVKGLLSLINDYVQREQNIGGAGGRAPAKIQSSGTTIQRQPTALNFIGATVADAGNGITNITLSAGGTVVSGEEVSGSGTSWTLAQTPTSGTLRVFLNGMRAKEGAGNDYTVSGTTITTSLSWDAGQVMADYSYT